MVSVAKHVQWIETPPSASERGLRLYRRPHCGVARLSLAATDAFAPIAPIVDISVSVEPEVARFQGPSGARAGRARRGPV